MARQDILVVDGDLRSLRVMEVSLRKAGFLVTTALDGDEAVQKIRISRPHLIISDTDLPKVNGFDLLKQVKGNPETAQIPFIFITSEKSIDHKIRGLELGVEDYLTKPIYIKEIIIRIGILLNRKEREKVEQNVTAGFIGSLADIGIVDVIQTAEMNRKSGILTCQGPQGRGLIYFSNGRVIDAELGKLRGEKAVYRLLLWNEGTFRMSFEEIDRPETIRDSNQALIMEGMRRMDEWIRIMEQLPKPETRLDVNAEVLSEKLSEIPDDVNRLLRLVDGQRSLIEVVDDSPDDEMRTLDTISKLYFEGIIFDALKGPATPRIPLLPEIKEGAVPERARESDWARQVFAEVTAPAQAPAAVTVETGAASEAPAAAVAAETAPAAAPVQTAVSEGPAAQATEASAMDTMVPMPPPPVTTPEIDIPRVPRTADRKEPAEERPAAAQTADGQDDAAAKPVEEIAEEQLVHAMLKHTPAHVRGAMMGKRVRRAERREGGSKVVWIFVAALVVVGAAGGIVFKDRWLSLVVGPPKPSAPVKVPAPAPRPVEPPKPAEPPKPVEPPKPQEPVKPPVEPVKEEPPPPEPAKKAEPGPAEVKTAPAKDAAPAYEDLLAKGQGLRNTGKNAAALKELKKAIAVNAKGAEAHALAGQILIEMDKAAEAAKHLKSATTLNPNDANAFFFLGTAYQIQGDAEKARKAYEKYLFLKPTGEFAKDIRTILKDLK